MEANIIKLEDGNNYIIIDTIESNNKRFLLLLKVGSENDIVFRKVIIEKGSEWLVKIDDVDEFEQLMTDYILKYRKSDENEG